MKILFMSARGNGLGVAERIRREGHDVLVYVHDESALLAGDGYLHKVASWRSQLADCGLVICDEPGFGFRASDLRGNGRPVLGCDMLADRVEFEPQKQIELFEACDVEYPNTSFWFSDDRRVLPEHRECVAKVYREGASHVLHTIRSPREWEWLLSSVNGSAMVVSQDITPGVECNVVGLWNGRSLLEPSFVTFDYRHAADGDLGPVTDCTGLVMRAAGNESKLVKATLGKFVAFFKQLSYRGMVTVRCRIDATELRVIGLRIGFSHDALDALGAALHEDNLGDVLYDCAIGMRRELKTTRDYVACVRLFLPPWPYSEPQREMRGLPLGGIDEKTLPWVNLCDVYKLSGGPAFAAGTGVVAKVLAHGRSVAEARSRVYRTLQNVVIAGGQYRTDIGEHTSEQYDELKANGWVV